MSTEKDPTQSSERHEFQFRGVWIPAEIIHLMADRSRKEKIKGIKIMVLVVVDSLVRVKGEGCWASNEYIADLVGLSGERVRKIINFLIGEGFLIKRGWKKVHGRRMRLLETCWSRIVDSEQMHNGRKRPPSLVENDHQCISSGNTLSNKHNRRSRPTAADAASAAVVGALSADAPIPFSPPRERRATKAPGARHPTEGGLMPGLSRACGPQESDRYLGLARVLQSITVANGNGRRHKPDTWARELRLLEQDFSVPPERIKEVLDWYAAHAKEITKPKVVSASQFRSVFRWLEELMEQDRTTNPDVVPGEVAGRIADRLAAYQGWPGGSADKLGVLVQVSLDRANALLNRLERAELPAKLSGLAEAVIGNMAPLSSFLQNWLEDVRRRISFFPNWKGNIMNHAFDPASKEFQRMAESWARQYCGNARRWHELWEIVK